MIIKNDKELHILREGGRKLAAVLNDVVKTVKPGVRTMELDELAECLILRSGGTPSFKGYKAYMASSKYPASLCVSVNDEVVHGIPSVRILGKGDVVGLDIGMWFDGYCTDTAKTVIVGEWNLLSENSLAPPRNKSELNSAAAAPTQNFHPKDSALRLVAATKKALELGIREVKAGVKTGDIGFAVQSHLEKEGFGVVRELVGHGVGKAVHEEPEIPNWGNRGSGVKLQEGLVIAIEPMAAQGHYRVKLAPDGWTWLTFDGSIAAHFEHTLVVTKNGSEVLTKV
ncbi:M24 family metallopeptidase [Candidatus Giovannonibacteria bacterium]|nr:M24 family metallopeptidase [Candidatus Giovannonibacteria bacterium]